LTETDFDQYMGEQIKEIREFKRELENRNGREYTLEEAAREWVKKYAKRFRDRYVEEQNLSELS